MKRPTRVKYPWEEIKRGQWFFVPALDLEATRELGLRYAVLNRARAKAHAGILNGRIGILFVCSGPPLGEPMRVQAAATDPTPRASDQNSYSVKRGRPPRPR